MRHASLPMYDADPTAVNAWWVAVADALRAEGMTDVPDAADWPDDLQAHWHDPALLLSQTCGYPLVTRLVGLVQVVGAFGYTAPGASGIRYRSALVARDDGATKGLQTFRGCTVAVNALDSYSGWHAWRASLAMLGPGSDVDTFFGKRVVSGSHRASLSAVQAGQADFTAIDCITLAGLRRHAPQLLAGLRVIGHTAPAPGLPLITSRETSNADLSTLRRALESATHDPRHAELRKSLFIGEFVAAPLATWDCIRNACVP